MAKLVSREQVFAERMAACRQTWESGGDPLVLTEALWLARRHGQVIDVWLEDAVTEALSQTRSKALTKRHRDNIQHALRYSMVKALHEVENLSWDEAKKAVAETLTSIGDNLSVATVWASYIKVSRYVRRHGHELTLQDIRYADLET